MAAVISHPSYYRCSSLGRASPRDRFRSSSLILIATTLVFTSARSSGARKARANSPARRADSVPREFIDAGAREIRSRSPRRFVVVRRRRRERHIDILRSLARSLAGYTLYASRARSSRACFSEARRERFASDAARAACFYSALGVTTLASKGARTADLDTGPRIYCRQLRAANRRPAIADE